MREGVPPDYSWVTDEMFTNELTQLLREKFTGLPPQGERSPTEVRILLAIHDLYRIEGIYEILSEEFNNEILDRLTEQWMTDKINTEITPATD